MQKLTPYQHAMNYQRRLDERTSSEELPSARQLITESGVLNAEPADMTDLKSKLRGILYIEEGLSNSKRKWVQQILNTLEKEYIYDD